MTGSKFTPKDAPRARRDFTRDEVLDRLNYSQETGKLTWKRRIQCFGGGRNPGDEAGSIKDGYVQISLFGKCYRAHHIIWLLMTGEWPQRSHDIDHINRNRADNRWSNLRLATRAQNNLNSFGRVDNTSGYRGVHPCRDKWLARISVNKQIIHLGVFADRMDAVAARKAAEQMYYPGFH